MSSPQLVPRLTSGRWTRGGSKGSTTSSSQAGGLPQAPTTAGPLRGGSLSRASLSRGSLTRTPQRNSSGRSARHHHHTLHARTAAHDHEDEVRQRGCLGLAEPFHAYSLIVLACPVVILGCPVLLTGWLRLPCRVQCLGSSTVPRVAPVWYLSRLVLKVCLACLMVYLGCIWGCLLDIWYHPGHFRTQAFHNPFWFSACFTRSKTAYHKLAGTAPNYLAGMDYS